jgi:hypothetical protein
MSDLGRRHDVAAPSITLDKRAKHTKPIVSTNNNTKSAMGAFIIFIIIIGIISWANFHRKNSLPDRKITNPTNTTIPNNTYTRETEFERMAREEQEQIQRLKDDEIRQKALMDELKQNPKIREAIAMINARGQESKILQQSEYKPDWEQYQKLLQSNNIDTLYHFTDRANLQSIKEHGALYSWDYCMKNNIHIPIPGGDELSRSLDSRDNLENFVRISFTEKHPMMYLALNQNRIKNPVILKIDAKVVLSQYAKFANMNATRNGVNIGSSIEDLQKVRFDIVKLKHPFELDEADKPYFQAEVLILEKIPIHFIRNIDIL